MRSLLMLAFVPMAAFAATTEEEMAKPVYAIQERHFRMQHEFTLSAGAMPADPYTKTFYAQFSYTVHFTDAFAWQIARGGAGLGVPSFLRWQLEHVTFPPVLPTEFDSPQFFAGTAIEWSPLYGKMSLLDKAMLYGEVYLMLGGSFTKFTYKYRPGVDVGGGVRLFLTRVLSLKFELMDTVALPFAGAPGLVNIFSASVGLSVNIGATE